MRDEQDSKMSQGGCLVIAIIAVVILWSISGVFSDHNRNDYLPEPQVDRR
jgi:hypothetical protein